MTNCPTGSGDSELKGNSNATHATHAIRAAPVHPRHLRHPRHPRHRGGRAGHPGTCWPIWVQKVVEVVALDDRARQAAAALADLRAQRALDGRAAEDADAWARRERALLEIKADLAEGKRPVDAVLGLIIGQNGRGGYSAHIYEKVVLPRVSTAMNAFLDRTASFQVVDAGGDLGVKFEASGTHTDLNQLGGADRFVLDLAARCALRQIGAPGFNWPVAP